MTGSSRRRETLRMVGQRVRRARARRDMSQTVLAGLAGTSQEYLSRLDLQCRVGQHVELPPTHLARSSGVKSAAPGQDLFRTLTG